MIRLDYCNSKNKYRITGHDFEITRNQDGKVQCEVYFSLKNLDFITRQLNIEVEEQFNIELKSLEDTKPEDIKF